MYYAILGISALFIGIGFILTEKNAKYLLSGYNTMSEKDRAAFDLKNYVPFFRKFHFYFGSSYLLIGVGLQYLYGDSSSGVFMGLYPIVAYGYFIWKSQGFSKGITSQKWEKAALIILALAFLLVGSLFYRGYQELELSFTSEELVIEGMYGEIIPATNIKGISLVEEIPAISLRKNGYSLGSIRKGYYKTKTGKTVKLLLDSDSKPIIYIEVIDGKNVYYASRSTSNTQLYQELKQNMHSVSFED